jgi:group I intron endonuclease
MIYTIYKSVNTKTGKVYIGFDSHWPNRMKIHKSASKNFNSNKFYNAIRKYGWDAFEWSPIYQSKDKEHTLKVMENFFITEYNSFHEGYNSTLGGDGAFGMTLSEESRRNISEKNKIPKPQTKEHVRKRTYSRIQNIKLGITKQYIPTEKHKRKISQSTRGVSKPMTDEHKKNLKCHSNNLTKVSCPHCGKVGQLTNMKRWHFDRCKLIP